MIDELKVFVLVANEKNVARVSKLTGLSRERINGIVEKIEKEVGSSLFIRTPNGTYLNEEGKQLYETFVEMINAYNQTISTITQNHLDDATVYKVAITPKIYAGYYSGEIKQFADTAFYIKYIVENYEGFYKAVIDGKADFAFMYNEVNMLNNKSITHLPIYDDCLCLMVSDKSELLKYDELTVNDISNQTIFYETEMLTPRIKQFVKKLSKNNNVTELISNYSGESHTINDSNNCFLWHYKNADYKNRTGLTPIPIVNSEETYYVIFKYSKEKQLFAEKIVEKYKR